MGAVLGVWEGVAFVGGAADAAESASIDRCLVPGGRERVATGWALGAALLRSASGAFTPCHRSTLGRET